MHVVGLAVGLSVGCFFLILAVGTIIYVRHVRLAQKRERKRQHEEHLEEMRAIATRPLYTYENEAELAEDRFSIDPALAEVPGNAIVNRAHDATHKRDSEDGTDSSENGIHSEFISISEDGSTASSRSAAEEEDADEEENENGDERAFSCPYGTESSDGLPSNDASLRTEQQQQQQHRKKEKKQKEGATANGSSNDQNSNSLRVRQMGGRIIVHIKDGANGEDHTKIYRRQNSDERYGRSAYYVSSPEEAVSFQTES